MRILVTGVFDLLHQEHRNFLLRAKTFGGQDNELIIGVECDARVRQLKGEGRPIQSQEIRVAQIQELGFVDRVILLPEDFGMFEVLLLFLKNIHPDFLVVSSHTPHFEEKRAMMASIGGRAEIIYQQNPGVSTTKLIS